MKYDFSSLIDRHGMDSIAVDSWGEIPGMAPNAPDEGFDRIPMWVADMNFATVPTVQEYIIHRAQHPMFGYFNPRPEYFDRIIEWQSRRNGVEGLAPGAYRLRKRRAGRCRVDAARVCPARRCGAGP